MKKLLLFSLSFLLVGCTGQNDEVKDGKGESQVEAPYYINLLKEFQTNPSVAAFYDLCEEGKDLETHITREVLSDDRLSMDQVPITLYEAIPSCEKIEDADFIFVTAEDTGLLAELKDSDTDEVRIRKIEFNDNINKKIRDNAVYGYDKISAEDITPFFEATLHQTKMQRMYSGYHKFISGSASGSILLTMNEIHEVICYSFRAMTGERGCFEF